LKPWKPGQTGNPVGKNGWSERNDLAAEIARAIFEQDGEAIFESFRKLLRSGSPYGYQVLADRAYGKLKETVRHERGPLADVPTEELDKQIEELETKFIGHLREEAHQVFPQGRDDLRSVGSADLGMHLRLTEYWGGIPRNIRCCRWASHLLLLLSARVHIRHIPKLHGSAPTVVVASVCH